MYYITIFIYQFYTSCIQFLIILSPLNARSAAFVAIRRWKHISINTMQFTSFMGWVSITLIANDTTTWGYPRKKSTKDESHIIPWCLSQISLGSLWKSSEVIKRLLFASIWIMNLKRLSKTQAIHTAEGKGSSCHRAQEITSWLVIWTAIHLTKKLLL